MLVSPSLASTLRRTPAMIHRAAFALLLLVLPSAAGAAPQPLGARALLDSVARRYVSLSRFHMEGRLHVTVKSDTAASPTVVDAPFLYAALRPSRLHNESRNPFMPTMVV